MQFFRKMGVVEAAQMGWEQLFNRLTKADIEGTGEAFVKAFNARVALVRFLIFL